MAIACDNQSSNTLKPKSLESRRLQVAVKARDCDQKVKNANTIIELLDRKTSEQLVKLGLGLAFVAVVTIGENLIYNKLAYRGLEKN